MANDLFPPWIETRDYDAHFEPVSDPLLVNILQRDYDRNSDLSLAGRPEAIEAVTGRARFAALCRDVRVRSEESLRAEQAFAIRLEEARSNALQLIGTQRARLDRRQQALTSLNERDSSLARRRLIADVLHQVVEAPRLRLEAIGAFIVYPPSPGGDDVTGVASGHPFEALRARLAGEDVSAPESAPPPIARLFRALDGNLASSLDLAILFRHVLRQEGGALRVPSGVGMPSAEDWAAVEVTATPVGEAYSVESRPWKPEWLPDVPDDGVDAVAARAVGRRRDDPAAADPYLEEFRYDSYRSPGQRRALRAALSAPRGSTLVVSLPTGEGKSLVFHALARIGLGDGPGVTLVVTPTVALAADHEQSSRGLGFNDPELAYRGGDSERNQPLLDRIRDGTQSLCFASPEAVCGALSDPLREAARRGRLRAVVVDEAHLIDSWGINFRPEFQMLAGLRQELLSLADASRFRTVLLSATLTSDSIEVLHTLFPGEPFRIVSAAATSAPRSTSGWPIRLSKRPGNPACSRRSCTSHAR